MKKFLYIGNPFSLECSLFDALINNGWIVRCICLGDHFNWTHIYNQIPKLFDIKIITETQKDIDTEIQLFNPDICFVRCWDSLANFNIPQGIFYKCESPAKKHIDEQIKYALPHNSNKAFLTMVKEELIEYNLNIPVGYLPYGVSSTWEKQGNHNLDIMATGTMVSGYKQESWEMLVKPLLNKYKVDIYQWYNRELMSWAEGYFLPEYKASDAPSIFNQYKLFICPISYRYDFMISHKIIQALGCGCLVITQRTPGHLKYLGEDGVNIVYADSEEEVTLKVDYYLNNQDKLNEVAKRGYEFIHKEYGFYNNFIRALNEIGINL